MIQLIILKLNKYVLKWYLYKDTILIKQYIVYIKPLLYYAYLNFYFNNIKLLKEKSIKKFVMVAHRILEMQLLMEETVTMF